MIIFDRYLSSLCLHLTFTSFLVSPALHASYFIMSCKQGKDSWRLRGYLLSRERL